METEARINARAIAILQPWSLPADPKDLRYRNFHNRVYIQPCGDHTLYWAGGPHRFCLLRLRTTGRALGPIIFHCPKDIVRPYKALKTDVISELVINPDTKEINHYKQKTKGLGEYIRYDWGDRIDEAGTWLDPTLFIKRLSAQKILCTATKAAFDWSYMSLIAETGDDLVSYKIIEPAYKSIRISGDYESGYVFDWGQADTACAIVAPLVAVNPVEKLDWTREFLVPKSLLSA